MEPTSPTDQTPQTPQAVLDMLETRHRLDAIRATFDKETTRYNQQLNNLTTTEITEFMRLYAESKRPLNNPAE